MRQVLQGEPVLRFMNRQPVTVAPSLSLRQWVEDFVYRYHRKTFPVVSDGHLEGCVDTRALALVPRAEWERHTVGEVMRHDLGPVTIAPDADALEALGQMRRTGFSRLLVTQGGRLVGIVGPEGPAPLSGPETGAGGGRRGAGPRAAEEGRPGGQPPGLITGGR